MEQVQTFITIRDQHIDHQLFGAKKNHRDMALFESLCGADGTERRAVRFDAEQLRPHFRRLAVIPRIRVDEIARLDAVLGREGVEPCPVFLPCKKSELDVGALVDNQETRSACPFIVTLDGEILEPKQELETDGTLAQPQIDSDGQVRILLGPGNTNSRSRTRFVILFSQWLLVRASQLRRRGETMNSIADWIDGNSTLGDDAFWEALYRFIYKQNRPEPQQNPPPNSFKRQQKRIDELKEVLPSQWAPHSILDIGCSDGFILEQFGEAFQVGKQDLMGLDIRPPASTRISFLEGSGEQFFEALSGKYDLVTISMTLHHIPHYKTVLQNAVRYLSPGGFLYIREHDAENNDYKMYLDLHDQAFNSAVWQEPESPHKAFVRNCRSWFLSKGELLNALDQAGLRPYRVARQKENEDWNVHGRVWWATFARK